MKTITITIQVPDGVNVAVNNGGQAQQRPFREQPDPPRPDGYCEIHDMDWKLIPAGVSKTKVDDNGNPKRFNAFWICPERGCDNKPPRDEEAPRRRSEQPVMVDISGPDLPF